MPIPSLTDWVKKLPLVAAHWQEAVKALRELDARVERVESQIPERTYPHEAWPAVIVDTGPAGEDDYADGDPRYYLKKQYLTASDPDAAIGIDDDKLDLTDEDPDDPFVVTGTNIAEYKAQSHLLDVDGSVLVWVWAVWDGGEPNEKHYVFSCQPQILVPVDLTQDGGADGDDSTSTTATWTYTATDPADGNLQLGTTLEVQAPRLLAVATTKATKGVGYFKPDGTFILMQAFESFAQGQCATT